MKKNIPTTIAGRLFYIEEDAFERLNKYLNSIKAHFASYRDNAEIISDIENRIAERFLESKHTDNVVTLANVESLIASMGNVEDFDDGEVESEKNAKEVITKKLFRNPDDVVIAGVSSGMAAYLGIDPLFVRVIFILIVLFGGSGVLIYIILWVIVPEAKTPTEKLQMRGERVTLESVKEAVKEKIDEVKEHKGTLRRIISLPFVILGKIVRAIAPITVNIFGGILTIAGLAAMIGFLFILGTVLFNANSPYIDFPLMQMGSQMVVYLAIFGAFLAAFVPALFLIMLGINIARRRNIVNGAFALALLGVWIIGLITLGVSTTRLIPEYRNFMETDPRYETKEMDLNLKDFTNISVQNGNRVHISIGDKFKVAASGSDISLQKLHAEVKDGTLNIASKDNWKLCIFCFRPMPEVNVILPKIREIDAANGSRVESEAIKTDSLVVKLSNGSRAKLILAVKNLEVEEENASYLAASGAAETLLANLSNACSLSAGDLVTKNVSLTVKNGSHAEMNAEKTLKVDLQNGSEVIYEGAPIIEKKIRNGSRLEMRNF